MPFPFLAAASIAAPLINTFLQGRENRRVAEFQAQANERYLQQQLEYNSPANQMKRFQDAGLNPNLVYGQGNPGNQSTPLTHPDIRPRDFGSLMQMIPAYNQSRLIDSQVQALNQKTMKDGVLTALANVQREVAERNPILRDSYLNAVIDIMKSVAMIKGVEGETVFNAGQVTNQSREGGPTLGQQKILKEYEILNQRFELDKKQGELLKAAIDSAEFKNAILEVQKKFIADGDIGPQQILSFIMLLTGKM